MKIYLRILFISLLLAPVVYPQSGPGKAYYPETANGASNVYFQYHTLRWQNPPNTIYNKVYLSFDSSKVANMDPAVLFISGSPGTVYDSIIINQQLYYPARYFWSVAEYGSSGFTQGDIWSFTTTRDYIDFYELDDFSFGPGNWDIQNTTTCGWQISDNNSYTLPDPAAGKLFTADVSLCGGPINSTAYFDRIDTISFLYYAVIHFDSDWQSGTSNDAAYVEISTDGGNNWSSVWQQVGLSSRNQHISIQLLPSWVDSILDIRLRTLQYGTGSWWSIDNFIVEGGIGILTHIHPVALKVNTVYGSSPAVILKWHQILPLPYQKVERKIGVPAEPGAYQTIAAMQASYYMEYIDSTVTDSTIYTYRIGSNEGGGCLVYSNEATAYIYPPVPVELISFTADVFGNQINLRWLTATETNNKGFEIERTSPLTSPAEGDEEEWRPIGFVQGRGTTTEQTSYSFRDTEVNYGTYKYRLKQTDYDGSYEYSDIVEVTIGLPQEYLLMQNYPNPFNPVTTIKYSIAEEGQVNLSIYNLLGQKIAELKNMVLQPGYYETEFNASSLSSGVYVYKLSAGGRVISRKMIVLR